ncbi:MAG: GAF domain-containing protein [Spirochaetaceae bacterium]|nr:MAG: GAF domain-containing protein [Spirochaetaceae bacterium]
MEETEKLKLIEEIMGEINSVSSSDELLAYLIDKCIEATGALTGSVMIISPETQILEVKAFRGLEKKKIVMTALKVGQGVTGMVAKTGKSQLVNDASKTKKYVRIGKNLKSELAVPLKIGDKTIGVISVDSQKLGAFDMGHVEIMETISVFIAQILQRLYLIEELNNKIKRQNLLVKVATILEEQNNLEKMFASIMDTISTTFNIKRGMLVLLDEDDQLKVTASHNLSQEAVERGVYQVGEGIIGRVYKSGQAIFIKNIAESKEFLNRMKIRRSHTERNSFFAVPIRYENKTVGVFSLEKEYHSESDYDNTSELMVLVAAIISNRIYNHVIAAREKTRLVKENLELKEKLTEKEPDSLFIGKNRRIAEILHLADQIADTDVTVLITGETGTGKEVLAQYIHRQSIRSQNPFVSINCAAIPENLLESELFGFKKGSFTGAISDKKGKFQLADQGTIFLDEIGDLDFSLQAKILRVLQEKQIEPIGSEKSIKIDVRVIAATNKNLKNLVSEKKFREDLYYRLNVIRIELPELKDRQDDIPLFIEHFISQYRARYKKNISGTTPRFNQILYNHNWPGNIRELQNVIERAILLSKNSILDEALLPEELVKQIGLQPEETLKESVIQEISRLAPGGIYDSIMERVEKYLIEHALILHNNKKTEAADYLGLHRNSLYQKLKSMP